MPNIHRANYCCFVWSSSGIVLVMNHIALLILILNEVRCQLTDYKEKYESNGIATNKKHHNFIGLIGLKKMWLQLYSSFTDEHTHAVELYLQATDANAWEQI